MAFCVIPRLNPGKTEKHFIRQGKCHKCSQWIAVEGIKDMESKVIHNFFFQPRICWSSLSRLKNYTGTVILLLFFLCILFSFHPERANRLLHFIYIWIQVETCSCLPSRLDTFWRMWILRNGWCFNEAFILKLGSCCYLTSFFFRYYLLLTFFRLFPVAFPLRQLFRDY